VLGDDDGKLDGFELGLELGVMLGSALGALNLVGTFGIPLIGRGVGFGELGT
jgi:hypothetical protein